MPPRARARRFRPWLAALCARRLPRVPAAGARRGRGRARADLLRGGSGACSSRQAERSRLAAAPAGRRARLRPRLPGARPAAGDAAKTSSRAAIERRRRLVAAERLSPFDDRGRLLFLRGEPAERHKVECGETFVPLEIWSWGEGPRRRGARSLYRPAARQALPPLAADRLEAAALHRRDGVLARAGRRASPSVRRALPRQASGPRLLQGRGAGRPRDRRRRTLRLREGAADGRRSRGASSRRPTDLAAWAQAAAATAPRRRAGKSWSSDEDRDVTFPARRDHGSCRGCASTCRRARCRLPTSGSGKEMRFAVGRLPRARRRGVRGVPQPLRLRATGGRDADRPARANAPLRPRERFVVRIEVRDEIPATAPSALDARDRSCPPSRRPSRSRYRPERSSARRSASRRLDGRDSVVLLPPSADVVFGLWRAEAIVAGDRIRKVVFYLDGKPQFTRTRPPWTRRAAPAEHPDRVVVRAEGSGRERRGGRRRRDPAQRAAGRGAGAAARAAARQEGRRARCGRARRWWCPKGGGSRAVEFRLNDDVLATLDQPPWETRFQVPGGDELAYLTVAATYDDGTRVEDFRVLNSTDFFEQVEVDLVEVYATVIDRPASSSRASTRARLRAARQRAAADDLEVRAGARAAADARARARHLGLDEGADRRGEAARPPTSSRR